jgi:hypothetical protein
VTETSLTPQNPRNDPQQSKAPRPTSRHSGESRNPASPAAHTTLSTVIPAPTPPAVIPAKAGIPLCLTKRDASLRWQDAEAEIPAQ